MGELSASQQLHRFPQDIAHQATNLCQLLKLPMRTGRSLRSQCLSLQLRHDLPLPVEVYLVNWKDASATSLEELVRNFEIAVHAADLGIWEWDLLTNEFVYSNRAKTIFGFATDDHITAERIREILHPDDLPVAQAQAARGLDPKLERRPPYRYRIHRANDGELRWIHAFGESIFQDVDGTLAPVKYIGTIQDVTEEVLAKQQLVEQAARLRLAVEAGGIAVWELNVANQTVTHSPELNRLCGFPPDARPTLEELRSRYAPGERERIEREGAEARARGDTRLETEIHHIWPDGTEKWLWMRAQLAPGESPNGGRVIGALVDITQQKTREKDQALLIAELQHRIKNSFSVMQSIVSQTLRGADVSEETRSKLNGRFQAMAEAHDVIAGGSWEAASLSRLVAQGLAAFDAHLERLKIEVEDVALAPRAALSFSLVLHELLTNAIKYGSLSNETGTINLAIRVVKHGSAEEALQLEWTERGGPIIESGEMKPGFGTVLTDRLFAVEFAAGVERTYRPTGMYFAMRVPIDKIVAIPAR